MASGAGTDTGVLCTYRHPDTAIPQAAHEVPSLHTSHSDWTDGQEKGTYGSSPGAMFLQNCVLMEGTQMLPGGLCLGILLGTPHQPSLASLFNVRLTRIRWVLAAGSWVCGGRGRTLLKKGLDCLMTQANFHNQAA